ncbi:MAG: glycoside hydrolase family 15 protein [Micrococcales bacterium]|nr:glycoside hydrolase family 15 protein [Micrococcales bacterium]
MTVLDTSRRVLRTASLDLIAGLQAPTGAFPACSTFAVYQYSWLRDGTYIALALDVAGRHMPASAFHRWVGGVIEHMSPAIDAVLAHRAAGLVPDASLLLPTRYTLDGEVEQPNDDAWPTVQLDGYGVWLWGLRHHLDGRLCPDSLRSPVRKVADYLVATWDLPCYDCWEEFGDRRHTSTLGAIAAGLAAAAGLLSDGAYQRVADEVVAWMRRECVVDGCLVKGPQDHRADASLLTLAVPLEVFDPFDPVMAAAAHRIEQELVSPGGGVYRYLGDTYYGGGAWLIEACWLGLYDLATGRPGDARRCQDWVIAHVDHQMGLPEQVTDEAQVPEMVQPWIEKWGPPASPLLWSHAMFVLLDEALDGAA